MSSMLSLSCNSSQAQSTKSPQLSRIFSSLTFLVFVLFAPSSCSHTSRAVAVPVPNNGRHGTNEYNLIKMQKRILQQCNPPLHSLAWGDLLYEPVETIFVLSSVFCSKLLKQPVPREPSFFPLGNCRRSQCHW